MDTKQPGQDEKQAAKRNEELEASSGRRNFLRWLTFRGPVSVWVTRSTFSFASLTALAKKASAQLVPHSAWRNRPTIGTLWTWGVNTTGQLGDGTTNSRSSPVHIGALAKYSDIAAGSGHTQAIAMNRTLWGMGDATYSAFGGGSTSTSSPVQVSAQTNWSRVSAGTFHTLGLQTDGTLWAWGAVGHSNAVALGVGDTLGRSSPVQVGTGTTWAQLSAYDNSGAIDSGGNLWMWGANSAGQVGDGTLIARSSPVQIAAGTTWSKIAVGGGASLAIRSDGTLWGWGNISAWLAPGSFYYFTQQSSVVWNMLSCGGTSSLGIASDGTLWGWGLNSGYEVGDGTNITRYAPVQISALTTWSKVFSGSNCSFAIKSDGTLWSWGNNAGGSILGNGGATASTPMQVGSATNWKKVIGANSTMAFGLRTDGTLWGWGTCYNGMFGAGKPTSSNVPIQIGTANNWTDIATNESTMYGIAGGVMYTWGQNAIYYQLGNGVNPGLPANLIAGAWATVATGTPGSGPSYFLGLKTDGTLWSFGSNYGFALGTGNTLSQYSPVQIGTSTWSSVSAGRYPNSGASISIRSDGTMWSWGFNGGSGILGSGTASNSSSPVQIGSASNWLKVSIGITHALGLKSDGTLWGWGTSAYGQIGDGTTATRLAPVQIGTLTTWTDVSAGDYHSLAKQSDGSVWAWGYNNFGQLGNFDSTFSSQSSPIQLTSLTNATVFAGVSCNFAVLSGALYAWGYNYYGQLGDNTAIAKSSPIQIGTLSNWSKISAGQRTTIALKTDGTIWSWGTSGNASLGDGTNNAKSSPVQIGSATNWTAVHTNGFSSFAIQSGGALWSWGDDLINGATTWATPTAITPTVSNWSSVSMNTAPTALRTDGTMWSWGNGTRGSIGDGAVISRSSPIQIGTATNWSQVVKGPVFGLAIRTDGSLWNWGDQNAFPAQGQGSFAATTSSPQRVGILSNWTSIATSQNSGGAALIYSLGIAGGNAYGAGTNASGQLGIITGSPIQLGSSTKWVDVNCSKNHALALQNDGSLWTWGNGAAGQLGFNNTNTLTVPTQLGTGTTWAKVAAGTSFSVALKTDGSLWSWGYNGNGQLGSGTTVSTSSPVQVGVFSNWTKIAAGLSHTVAKK